MLSSLPYLAALGNHEGAGALFGKYFPYPQYASSRYYYSFDYGPVHFVIIDQYTDYTSGSAQYNWLVNDLATSTKKWKILMCHEPGWTAYPSVGGHANNISVQNLIQPLCLQYGVQFVFSGHNHFYSRANVNNVMHITTGGGGAPLYAPEMRPNIVRMDKSNHFCKIDIDGNTMVFTAERSDGTIIETINYTNTSSSGTSNGIQILQAEDATVSGPVVATNQTGYYGTGFIDFVNATGDYLQWTVNVPTAGTYDLSFRYSLLSGSRPLELKVNGAVKIASLDFPITGSWSAWEKVITSQTLNAGNNTIRLTTIGSNGGNIDELVAVPYIDNCDAVTGWLSASTNTLSYYTTDKKQGAGCVQMVGSATDEFKKVFSPAYNSNVTLANGALSFWYYVSDVTKCGTVRVELGSGGVPDVNELSWPLSGLVNGWNKITLNLSSAIQTGTPNLNELNWFRIYNTKTASITTRIDAIQLIEAAALARAPKIVNSIDDSSPIQDKSVNVYPNPFKQGKLSVDITGFENMDNVLVKVTNLMGQTIYQEQLINKTHTELNLQGKLNESVYFISVESGDMKVNRKLIVN